MGFAFGFIIFALLLISGISGCSYVPPGNVGVVVYSTGSDKGVSLNVRTPGYYWLSPMASLYNFPTFTQNYTWSKNPNDSSPNDESISFTTVDGLSVGTDVGIAYHIEPDKVPIVFQKYREGIKEITNIALHNMVRNALVTEGGKVHIEEVYGSGKDKLMKDVLQDVNNQANPIGIVVEQLNWVGKPELPDSIIKSINNKIQATQLAQQTENEVAVARAQAEKAVATATGEANSILVKADAEARANKIIAASLSPELIQWEIAKSWNGALPTVSGGATPFINLPSNVTSNTVSPLEQRK